jgi:hypothetical protein
VELLVAQEEAECRYPARGAPRSFKDAVRGATEYHDLAVAAPPPYSDREAFCIGLDKGRADDPRRQTRPHPLAQLSPARGKIARQCFSLGEPTGPLIIRSRSLDRLRHLHIEALVVFRHLLEIATGPAANRVESAGLPLGLRPNPRRARLPGLSSSGPAATG